MCRFDLKKVFCVLTCCTLAAAQAEEYIQFSGISDASAGIVIGTEKTGYKFLIADDEEPELRLFSPGGGAPEKVFSIQNQLALSGKQKEFDLEGAARIGDTAYWITSHGRSSKGKVQLSRYIFFATEIDDANLSIKVKGKPFHGMLDALLASPELAAYDLKSAALLPPKEKGGLNIEGLCASPEGWLWIGFRNPVPKGKALLVPLKNPEKVILGGKPDLGTPITLDLGGLGVRDLCYTGTQYYIIGGPQSSGTCKLFRWDGKKESQPQEVIKSFKGDFGAEIILNLNSKDKEQLYVLCDDGGKKINGVENKKQPLKKRTFRGLKIPE